MKRWKKTMIVVLPIIIILGIVISMLYSYSSSGTHVIVDGKSYPLSEVKKYWKGQIGFTYENYEPKITGVDYYSDLSSEYYSLSTIQAPRITEITYSMNREECSKIGISGCGDGCDEPSATDGKEIVKIEIKLGNKLIDTKYIDICSSASYGFNSNTGIIIPIEGFTTEQLKGNEYNPITITIVDKDYERPIEFTTAFTNIESSVR